MYISSVHYINVLIYERNHYMKANIIIQGMSCGHCVQAVTKELQKIPSIIIEKVHIGEAKVSYDKTRVTHDDFIKAIDNAGYELLCIEEIEETEEKN